MILRATVLSCCLIALGASAQAQSSPTLKKIADTGTIHLKGADNHLVEAEELTDEELDALRRHYRDLAASLGSPAAAPRRRDPSGRPRSRSNSRSNGTKR